MKLKFTFWLGFCVFIVVLGFMNESSIPFIGYSIYWTLVLVLMIESFSWVDQQVIIKKNQLGHKYNKTIFLIQLLGMVLPISLFFIAIPTPLYLLLTQSLTSFVIHIGIIIVSFISVSTYALLTIDGSNVQSIRQRVRLVMTRKPVILVEPSASDILPGNVYGERIDSRQEKVELKIACGHCFHVFTVETDVKRADRSSFPCPSCGSTRTTPIWE